MQAEKARVINITPNNILFEHIQATMVLLEHNLANIEDQQELVKYSLVTNVLILNTA